MTFILKYKIVLIAFVFFIACSQISSRISITKNYEKIGNITWLIGSWKNNKADGRSVEEWIRLNDSTLAGKSFFIVNQDTISSESIIISQVGQSLFYIPTVKNQNAGLPVKFKLTIQTPDKFVFENPEHDFPTKITYNKITNNFLLAEISGTQNGKERSELFPMKKNVRQ